MFHLGWFTNFMPPKSWRTHWGGQDAEEWATGKFYVDFAKSLERACFDYMMLEDSLMVPDIFAGPPAAGPDSHVLPVRHLP